MVFPSDVFVGQGDAEDEDLRAALELSMHPHVDSDDVAADGGDGVANHGVAAVDTSSSVAPVQNNDASMTSINDESINSGDIFDCVAFHRIMWDDAISTTNDKERWIYECISTSAFQDGVDNTVVYDESTLVSPLEALTGSNLSDTSNNNTTTHDNNGNTTPPTESMHHLWGLTQKHGGPCGVLAAIQAEMIRLLLFGRNNGQSSLCYPFSPYVDEDEAKKCHPVTVREVNEALAKAIGMILARAAITPAASGGDVKGSCTSCVCLVFPLEGESVNGNTSDTASQFNSPWILEMLNSSTKLQATDTTTARASGLKVHKVIAQNEWTTQDDDDTSPDQKRQRKKEVSFAVDKITPNNKKQPKLTPMQSNLTKLAEAVADFLLGRGEDTNVGDGVKTVPLDYFKGPAGVMYFVMSLVESRGIERIRSGEYYCCVWCIEPSSSLPFRPISLMPPPPLLYAQTWTIQTQQLLLNLDIQVKNLSIYFSLGKLFQMFSMTPC